MQRDFTIEKQIDRACSAQSKDMLPKTPLSPEEKALRKKQIEAKINQQFADL